MKNRVLSFFSVFLLIISSLVLSACGDTTYNISFIVDSEVYATVKTNGTDLIQMPENPKKEDYIFDGWYWDEGVWKQKFTSKSLEGIALSSELKVYAHFVDEFYLKGTEIEIKDAIKLNIEGLGEAYYLSFRNNQIVCKFNEYINVNPNSNWEVCTDIACNNSIKSKTVELETGDSSVYYIYVTDKNNNHDIYFVLLHRNYMYDVTFNSKGGSYCAPVKVEEGYYLNDIPTPSRTGYIFEGWDYDFKNKPINDNVTAYANWSLDSNSIAYSFPNGGDLSQNEYIYFGRYPQKKVDASIENGLSSIKFDESTWVNYIPNEMYYKDIDVDADGLFDYRGVYYLESNDFYAQEENGYQLNEIYWFEYEKITWKILSEKDGKILISPILLLDTKVFYTDGNYSGNAFSHNGGIGVSSNYELSDIRIFLNNEFYNTAFNDVEKEFVETTKVSTKVFETKTTSCTNYTNDKIFLFSYAEVMDYFPSQDSRIRKGTDYAKALGLNVIVPYDNSTPTYSQWWLRSPYDTSCLDYVNENGYINDDTPGSSYTGIGVCLVCWISLFPY